MVQIRVLPTLESPFFGAGTKSLTHPNSQTPQMWTKWPAHRRKHRFEFAWVGCNACGRCTEISGAKHVPSPLLGCHVRSIVRASAGSGWGNTEAWVGVKGFTAINKRKHETVSSDVQRFPGDGGVGLSGERFLRKPNCLSLILGSNERSNLYWSIEAKI